MGPALCTTVGHFNRLRRFRAVQIVQKISEFKNPVGSFGEGATKFCFQLSDVSRGTLKTITIYLLATLTNTLNFDPAINQTFQISMK